MCLCECVCVSNKDQMIFYKLAKSSQLGKGRTEMWQRASQRCENITQLSISGKHKSRKHEQATHSIVRHKHTHTPTQLIGSGAGAAVVLVCCYNLRPLAWLSIYLHYSTLFERLLCRLIRASEPLKQHTNKYIHINRRRREWASSTWGACLPINWAGRDFNVCHI